MLAQTASTWVYNAANQVSGVLAPGATTPSPTPYTYDAAGNVTMDIVAGNQYSYDAEGRVCAVANTAVQGLPIMTQYIYDADGVRVAKGAIHAVMVDGVPTLSCDTTQNGFTPTTVYVLGPANEQLSELTNNGGTWQWAHTNVYAAGMQIATYDADSSGQTNGKLYFHLSDWLGTRRQETDYAGNPMLNFTGLPYGDGLSPIQVSTVAAADATEHHFTGKERDAESGNDYFEARYYGSSMGRFLSPDPYNIIFEMLKGRDRTEQMQILTQYLSNPQSLNKYSYVINNPLTMTDPDGLREANDQDRKAFEQLNQAYINAGEDSSLKNALAGAALALQNAIAAVPDGAKDPAQIGAVEWAIGQIGNSNWGFMGSGFDNGHTANIGAGKYKCSTFVATAFGTGAGVGYGGSGFPVGKLSTLTFWTRNNALGANVLASDQSIPNLPIAGSPSFGSIAAFPKSLMGHAVLEIGGGAVVYAGPNAAIVQTEGYVQKRERTAARYRDYKP